MISDLVMVKTLPLFALSDVLRISNCRKLRMPSENRSPGQAVHKNPRRILSEKIEFVNLFLKKKKIMLDKRPTLRYIVQAACGGEYPYRSAMGA